MTYKQLVITGALVLCSESSLDWIPVGADYYINSLEELPELLESINDTTSL